MNWREETLDHYAERWRWAESDDAEARRIAESEWFRNDEVWRTVAPARFADASPEDLDGAADEAFQEWRQDASRNLLLLGPVGTGKTHAAYAIVRHCWMRGLRFHPTAMVELLNDLRPGGDGRLSDYLDPFGLFIDDLGTEKQTEWVAEQVYGIIDGRWRNRKPIIATSNLSPQALKDALGERAWSRLQDDAVAVTLTGDDRRRS